MNNDTCPLARRAGPTLRLSPEEAVRFASLEGWVLLEGIASLESSGPEPRVVQLARAGDIVGWTPMSDQQAGAVLRALTPCVLWQLPEPADEAARLQLSMQQLSQQAARAREMAMLRTGGPTQRVKRLLESIAAPAGAAVGDDAVTPLPSQLCVAAIVGLQPAVVSRALDRLQGRTASRNRSVRPIVRRLPRATRNPGIAVPPISHPYAAARPNAIATH